MATNKKKAMFVTLATGADAVVQVDPDIYNATIITELGITLLPSSVGAKRIKVTLAQLGKSSFAKILKVSCSKGLNTPDEETRTVKLICEASKVAAAQTGLLTKKLKLGYGAAAVDWDIVSVA